LSKIKKNKEILRTVESGSIEFGIPRKRSVKKGARSTPCLCYKIISCFDEKVSCTSVNGDKLNFIA
jgi:hypothetical protein